MADPGDTPTDKTIVITVREDTFDVSFDGLFTLDEVYAVFVASLQHLEENYDEIVDSTGSSMVH